jgi:hypothetical protein
MARAKLTARRRKAATYRGSQGLDDLASDDETRGQLCDATLPVAPLGKQLRPTRAAGCGDDSEVPQAAGAAAAAAAAGSCGGARASPAARSPRRPQADKHARPPHGTAPAAAGGTCSSPPQARQQPSSAAAAPPPYTHISHNVYVGLDPPRVDPDDLPVCSCRSAQRAPGLALPSAWGPPPARRDAPAKRPQLVLASPPPALPVPFAPQHTAPTPAGRSWASAAARTTAV